MRSEGEARDAAAAPRPSQRGVLALALLVLMGLATGREPRMAALLLLGAALGLTLYHAAFGFTGAYRRLIVARDTRGVEAQLLMLGAATLLFAPVLAVGSAFGREVIGALAPVGWQVAAGAFLFGIGMQLGNGCGSGTLYALGGGATRMLVTLAAFVAGSFWASLHMGWWQALPARAPIALGEALGWPAAVALQLAFLFALWVGLRCWGRPPCQAQPALTWRRVLTGPWSLLTGGLALAGLNFLTLLIAGHPWSITWAFTLWGAKIAVLLGWDPGSSDFWQGDFQRAALEGGVLDDVTSLMDIGLVVGALCAAALAGRFMPPWRVPLRSLAAALIGGLLMGYGARIGFGCNIGAFFSGVASTSLHGWLWIAAALPGTWIGIRLRPVFGLPPDPVPPRIPTGRPHPHLVRLRVGATVAALGVVAALVLRLINAADFGPAGQPAAIAIRFAVETVVFTVLVYAALHSLPLRRKPGLRGTAALGLWVALVVLSDCLSRLEYGALESMLAELRVAMGLGGLVLGIVVYMLALALPFVPGVEIGLLVIMLFGSSGATAVYLATIAGLGLAFAAGRLIPTRVFVRLLARLGVVIPDEPLDAAVRRVVAGEPATTRGGWSRFAAWLVKHRYLALALAFNLPGNSVLGGGGGIALLCGASRQFKWYWFMLTVVVATSPVPVLVVAGGLDVRDLARLHDFVQNALAGLFVWL